MDGQAALVRLEMSVIVLIVVGCAIDFKLQISLDSCTFPDQSEFRIVARVRYLYVIDIMMN